MRGFTRIQSLTSIQQRVLGFWTRRAAQLESVDPAIWGPNKKYLIKLKTTRTVFRISPFVASRSLRSSATKATISPDEPEALTPHSTFASETNASCTGSSRCKKALT
jgi:hypothetical protein